ncbi:hypothetical protein [Ruminococcus callidus]|uniref:hypothetical protein n=1 Tax=Ruminococcus callidus TaxID=40519 RepID=UPI0023F651E7|nr:hypothetical protein [Ruminococcus callidus]
MRQKAGRGSSCGRGGEPCEKEKVQKEVDHSGGGSRSGGRGSRGGDRFFRRRFRRKYRKFITQPPTEASKYQKTNSYNIPCNGNSELAIEAANVFADKYGGSSYDWNLTSVDASVSGMEGTYRYTYSWAGNTYTATRKFKITDYGTYRNYSWEGDIANLFYGS